MNAMVVEHGFSLAVELIKLALVADQRFIDYGFILVEMVLMLTLPFL